MVLPIALALIMLGMGLSLEVKDFVRITKYPKAVAIGLSSQLIILPLLGFGLASVLPMPPAIAVGLIIIALCPGGVSSNMITYLAKGDMALSVTLTLCSSIITIFTLPILANLTLGYFGLQEEMVALPIGSTMAQIFLITVLPIIIGMVFNYQFPQLARKLEKITTKLAIAFLGLIILVLLIREWDKLPDFVVQAGLGVLLLNVLSMFIGFGLSKLARLEPTQQICIAIEVGIQNGTLAIAITAGMLNNPDMAIPGAIYSLMMYLTGFGMIRYGLAQNQNKA